MYKLAITLLVLTLTAVSCSEEVDETVQQRGRTITPEAEAVIYDGDEQVVTVQVALAQTDLERSTGLMDVHELPFDSGMLFLFDDERPRSFWMVNTPISLDILFLDSNRKIVRIRTNTTPFSERQITSELPARYVLEVNAGFTREHDIREGMRLEW
ncbi:DUF192 domain-containing protein [Balneolales bacterium ANBcel1]|nr:DUF192 domain-containing protein [Balneolales bacterium ANBcel1]